MDTRTNMILIKGKPRTSDVLSYAYDSRYGKWEITFTGGRVYSYRADNVVILKNPKSIDPGTVHLERNGRGYYKITAIFSFAHGEKEYWHICFENGSESDCCTDELQITRSALANPGARQVFDYLREVACHVSVQTEDGTPILKKQYEKISFLSEETAAAIYLNPTEYAAGTDLDSSAPIFPFGCNESQYQAVINALSNRLSVIEGPPGTGKTQTILNILANLIIQGKTAQVVSNNNSAIGNIVEKLSSSKYQMDFFTALLGKEANKDAFLDAQTGLYPDLSPWRSEECDTPEFREQLRSLSAQMRSIFSLKNELALLQSERERVRLEQEHFAKLSEGQTDLTIFSKKLTSAQVSEFLQEYLDIQDGGRKAGLLYRIIRRFTYGVKVREVLCADSAGVLRSLQSLLYSLLLNEIEERIRSIEQELKAKNADEIAQKLTDYSLRSFRNYLAGKYDFLQARRVFRKDDLWQDWKGILLEYPVILSTTYTARSSLGKEALLDYVIMDEASQIDVSTGMLALSCAANAVIVGDTKQLTNVVSSSDLSQLREIFERHSIREEYDFASHSFLSSLRDLLGERVPVVTLREHYRCHPQIIEFCNQKFYNNELIVMTPHEDSNALKLVITVPGKHERDHMNQRQIDVIRSELLPGLQCEKSEIGIIAPYNKQVDCLKEEVDDAEIDISTVHKFQGREKDVMILSTVDNRVTRFSDDPNLLNVAISRAKK